MMVKVLVWPLLAVVLFSPWPFLPRGSDVIVLDEASWGLEDTSVMCPQGHIWFCSLPDLQATAKQ